MALLACTFSSLAVDGVAVGVHSTYTHAFGWHFGNIERFIITNNVPDGGTVIYSASNGQRARCVSISPRGSRVAFIREDGKICVKANEEGGSVTVLANIPNDAWIDWPTENYVYYVNQWQGDELWRVNTSGTPSPSRVATGLGSAMQFSVDTNLTRGTSVTCCYSARSYTISGGSINYQTDNGGCGAGISPSGRYFTNNQGDHASVRIRNFDGSQLHYFEDGDCSGAGSNWNRNRWSANSDDWVSFTQGIEYQLGGGHHQVLYKKDGSQCIQVQPLQSGHFHEGDDFWVGTLGPRPPSLALGQSSLSFSANLGGGNPANQNVSVSNGGDGDLPTLTASESAGWLTVNIQSNGTNSPTLVNSVDISGLAGNVYNATVTVSGSGVSSVSYTVQLTVVAPPVLSTITVSPSVAYVVPGATQQFSAAGQDQYGEAFTLSGTQWTVTGGGTISSGGLFTAGGTEGGPYTVRATVGSVNGEAQVTVATTPPVHLKVNCGDNSPSVAGWEDDDPYVVSSNTGGSYDFSCTPDVSGAVDPAPADLYKTVRHQNHAYTFPDIADGTYTVRLHFMDQPGGGRAMDYTIEGVTVLDDFSIEDAAGGTCKAVVRDFEVQVTDGNGLQIVCDKDAGNDVFEAGIEIIGGASTPAQTPPITVVAPNGGEAYRVGDTLRVSWEWDTTITGGVAVWISPDDGESWHIMTSTTSVPSHAEGTNVGTFEWLIPATVDGQSLVSDHCRIRAWEYTMNELADLSDGTFTIQAQAGITTTIGRLAHNADFHVGLTAASGYVVAVRAAGSHRVEIMRLDGSQVACMQGAAPREYRLSPGALSHGTYLVRASVAGRTTTQRFTVMGR